MTFHSDASFLYSRKTPKGVKLLIWLTVLTTLLSPIFTFLFNHFFHMSGPSQWFALSGWGLRQGWLWEPFTYAFIHTAGVGISLSLLISLFFHMLLLWFFGSELHFRFGARAFFLFYLGGAAIAGILSAAALLLFSGLSVIVGCTPPLYALLIVWAMLYKDLELSLLFLLRAKVKWVVAIFLGISLLIDLSYGELIPLLADVIGIIWGFSIGRFVWKLPNPYPLNLAFPKRKKRNQSNKIIDLGVMRESDQDFMDRMLDKISKNGQESLSKRERERMNKISEHYNPN